MLVELGTVLFVSQVLRLLLAYQCRSRISLAGLSSWYFRILENLSLIQLRHVGVGAGLVVFLLDHLILGVLDQAPIEVVRCVSNIWHILR